ncbi:hypothetical protein Cs7R123_33420 [Catellatospora sp. TT07R-123]|uniref:DUF885 domain-containing protein n=1 Tax=Catellatospora sp. TT07R-123 TaxID=2733863 RepID=UPI001B22EC77|nr:DUF885 domain-containing protein [Catellatospora sp. TT07R-123]GHJ46000.1 hypothetical protein Cs7R123_33420 [Catellatospora sp. TT07R-123]
MTLDFAPLAEHIADALLEASPELAADAGDHRFDDRLPDLSPDGVLADVNMLRDASGALSQVDPDALDEAERVDHAILSSLVDRRLFELSELKSYQWDPLWHNPGTLLHALLARPFAPAEQRLHSLARRLAQVPDALATARGVLRDCPRIHLETAVGQFAGTAALVRSELPQLLAQEPGLADQVQPLAQQAVAALEEFSTWCARQVERGDGRSPRLGRRLWEAKLWYTLDTELTAADVLKRAQENLRRVTEELREVAVALEGGAADDATVRRALDRLADSHPDDATIIAAARAAVADTTAFVRQHDLVSLIDDPLVIEEMPEFSRGVAVAYCDPPGALETAQVPTFYCISPTPAGWSPERVRSFYREYNHHSIKNLTVHEAMPGHFLQLAHGRRYRGSTRVRALGRSGTFTEGWAVYAEELMVANGYGGLAVRAQQLKMQLRMSINAILDQLVHCEELSEAEGMALMLEQGFQEEGEAAGKWRRSLLSSAQLSTYFVGWAEVSEIGRARPDGVSVRDWHDRMLSYGCPPPRHLRALLGG